MAPTRRGRSSSGSRTRFKYLDAMEAKNKLTDERYRRAQEERREMAEELRKERLKSAALVQKVEEMSARIDALITQIGELMASSKTKRKRSPKRPRSDEEDSPAVTSRPTVAKRPARADQVSTPPPACSPEISILDMEEDTQDREEEVPQEEEAPKTEAPKKDEATAPTPAPRTMAEALKSPAARTPAQTPAARTIQAPATAAPPSAAVKAAEKKKAKFQESIPPVVIDGNDDWTEVRRKLKSKNINFRSAHLTARSTRIVPATVDDFRKLTKQLDEDKRGYHSFTLGQDKCFHVVVRKLAMNTDPREIQLELQEAYGIAAEVSQMMDRRKKRPMPLFLVKTKDARIHDVKTLFDLGIKIEEKKRSKEPTQCYRCQAIGHSQQHCHHAVRCVACGGNHRSTECPLEKPKEGERNAHCCNCDSDGHPANYRGCPKFPKRTYAAAARQGKPDATRGSSGEQKKTGPSQPANEKKTQPKNQTNNKTKTTATKQIPDRDQILTQIQALLALLDQKQC